MKKYFFLLFFSLSFNQLIGQNFVFTKTKITLKNEFGIPYPNAVIILSSSDTNYVVNIDNDGEGIIDLVKGIEFTVTSYINDEKFKFDEIIFIEKNKNINQVSIDLQFDLYKEIFEIKNLNFPDNKYKDNFIYIYKNEK